MKKVRWVVWALVMVWGWSTFGVVENDNVLKGVLREDGFTVIQDVGSITASRAGWPTLVFTDGLERRYCVATKLNTIVYAGTHASALAQFVSTQDAVRAEQKLKLSPERNYIEVSQMFQPVMMADAYRSVLESWQKQLATINQTLIQEMEKAGKDAVDSRPAIDPATVDFKRDVFETREEYAQRIESGNPYVLGAVLFKVEDYNIDEEIFPCMYQMNSHGEQWMGMKNLPSCIGVGRDDARRIFQGGPEYPLLCELAVDRSTSEVRVGISWFVANGMRYGENVNGAEPEAGKPWYVQLGAGGIMELLPVAAGSFEMGSNKEKPVHTVRIGEPFWLGKTEVTQAEYQQVMGTNPSKFTGEDLPVENVSWGDAIAFCEKLTQREHAVGRLSSDYEYTLPSEAQWEYAARGGAKSRGYTYSGSDNVGDVAWYVINSGYKTHSVGKKRANELGIYDMNGNVWEWCLDNWHRDYKGAPTDGRVWSGGNALYRVSRGGSWYVKAGNCRSAFRYLYVPTIADSDLGFRVAVVRK